MREMDLFPIFPLIWLNNKTLYRSFKDFCKGLFFVKLRGYIMNRIYGKTAISFYYKMIIIFI